MPPARLYLVRHGETDWNRDGLAQGQSDIPLNDTGRAQMRALAERLDGLAVHAHWTSPLSRARESATILAGAVGVPPRVADHWGEMHLGQFEGQPASSLSALIRSGATAETPLGGGGESFAGFRTRVVGAWDELASAHDGDDVLLVAHGGVLKFLIGHLIGLEGERLRALSIRTNASLSVVDFRSGHAQLALLNDAAHLGGLPK